MPSRRINPLSIRSALFIPGLAFLAGCFHEGLQILTAGQWPGWPAEMLDLSMDVGGAAIGLALVGVWTRRKSKQK
ncbi:MAG TPA: hypothetical protein VF359_00500 [Anaerolineales bacterium]